MGCTSTCWRDLELFQKNAENKTGELKENRVCSAGKAEKPKRCEDVEFKMFYNSQNSLKVRPKEN